MKRTLRIRVADPAGNITIFVLDPVDRAEYAPVAQALLAIPEFGGEQVAFVTGPDSMEMCGLEFCGNASRSFALMVAESLIRELPDDTRLQLPLAIPVHVSGADGPLTVEVDPETSYTRIRMPLHRQILKPAWTDGTLVDFGGIAHLVLEDVPATEEAFADAKARITELLDPPALGVLFCEEDRMTPVVYVRDVDTIYYEGSCGSGTTACAVARSLGRPDGSYHYQVCQPAGTLATTATVSSGEITDLWIEGEVLLSDPVIVTLDLSPSSAESASAETFSAGFPSLAEFREMVVAELEELPEAFFDHLSGGVLVEEDRSCSPHARNNDLYTLGNYSVSPLGRQIRLYYGSFRASFPGMDRAALRGRIREVVRHEFRHHLEFLGGVHGRDSLEAADRQAIREYLQKR